METISPKELPYPIADEGLGEKLYPNEKVLADQIADEIEGGIRKQYTSGTARRDVHAKLTGCLKAEFRVNESVPNGLGKGVFVPGKIYQALIRFSNASGDPSRSDDNEDTRGMAIKLLDVPGNKVLENDSEAKTQDFMLINYPVFLTNDPKKYLSLIQKSSGNFLQKLSIPITLGLKGTLITKIFLSSK